MVQKQCVLLHEAAAFPPVDHYRGRAPVLRLRRPLSLPPEKHRHYTCRNWLHSDAISTDFGLNLDIVAFLALKFRSTITFHFMHEKSKILTYSCSARYGASNEL